MKRLAILLAAVGLGSGCVIETSPNQGEAIVYWSYWSSGSHGDFGTLSSTSTEVCTQAGVDQVDVTLIDPAGYVAVADTGTCITGGSDVPGAVYSALAAGTWKVYLDAYRGGVLVFTDVQTFQVYDGSTTTVDTYPTALYGDLELNFTVPTCIAGDTVELDLYDAGTPALAWSTYAGTTNPPVAIGCVSQPTRIFIPSVPAYVAGVSSGSYQLSNLTHRDSNGLVVSYPTPNCVPHFTQTSPTGRALSITLDTASTAGAPGTLCANPL